MRVNITQDIISLSA